MVQLLQASDVELNIDEASSGEKALAKIGRSMPDLVILDLELGNGMDGFETLACLTEAAPQTRAIVLTMATATDTASKALTLGAIDCLRKDQPPEQILERILAAIHA